MATSDKIDQLAALLEEAAETHHHVYRITDGDDDDWASWYTDWLLNLSELEQLLGARPVRSHLVHALVQLDRDHTPPTATNPGRTTTPATSVRSSAPRSAMRGRPAYRASSRTLWTATSRRSSAFGFVDHRR